MYRDFFNLSGKPFQLSPDARFFFPSKEHKRALSFLQYGLSQADGFIVVTGDVGTGKSTLVQALLADLDADEMRVANLVTTQLGEDDTLAMVAMNFGLKIEGDSKARILKDLEHLFVQITKNGQRALLIVDEAQNLPPKSVEELRMLSNFQHEGKPLLQIFLLGQEEFRDTLLSEGFEQLRQRIIATYHLNPLSEEETRTYIEHRLGRVNWEGNPAFASEAFKEIFFYTEGVPRRINNLCDRLLLFCYLEEQNSIDGQTVSTVAEEIGSEFLAGSRQSSPVEASGSESIPVLHEYRPPETNAVTPQVTQQSEPLETMARSLFDKANVQQRLSSMERALDNMGHGLKEEIAEIKDLLLQLLKENRKNELPRERTAQSGKVHHVSKRNRAS